MIACEWDRIDDMQWCGGVKHANNVSKGIVNEAMFMTILELGVHDDCQFGFRTILPNAFPRNYKDSNVIA
jgi:hypothetical protein